MLLVTRYRNFPGAILSAFLFSSIPTLAVHDHDPLLV